MDKLYIGQKVRLNFLRNLNLTGVIVDIQCPLSINGVVFSSEKYKVEWDNGDTSKWIRSSDLSVINSDTVTIGDKNE